MKQRSGYKVMLSLIKLVKPLTLYMILAILMGLIGHLCASFITILSGYAILDVLDFNIGINLSTIFIIILLCALFRGVFRYIEQSCNHYIAFKLLALLRDKVFVALRKLCPAKLEGRDKGKHALEIVCGTACELGKLLIIQLLCDMLQRIRWQRSAVLKHPSFPPPSF